MIFRYKTLRCTYVDANVKTEHYGLYIQQVHLANREFSLSVM